MDAEFVNHSRVALPVAIAEQAAQLNIDREFRTPKRRDRRVKETGKDLDLTRSRSEHQGFFERAIHRQGDRDFEPRLEIHAHRSDLHDAAFSRRLPEKR